jgi:hypothetical protein
MIFNYNNNVHVASSYGDVPDRHYDAFRKASSLARLLASHRGGPGSILGRDMSVSGPLVKDRDDLGEALPYTQ